MGDNNKKKSQTDSEYTTISGYEDKEKRPNEKCA